MKSKLWLVAILFLLFFSVEERINAQAPDWLWSKSMGGTGDDEEFSIALDAYGNVYTTGLFFGTVDFDPGAGTFNLTGAGSNDIFISKLDSWGNFVWAKATGGLGSDVDVSMAIEPTGSGHIYTTGYFEGTADFDPDSSLNFNLTSAGYSDIFVSKLDSSGNFVWAKAIGGTQVDVGVSIAFDVSGNVYITGSFEGTVDFDPGVGVFNLAAAGGIIDYDIFILKLDSSGSFVWAKQMGGTTSYERSSAIVLDPTDSANIYAVGYFKETVDFDPGIGVFNLTSAGNYDIFISKLDSSGNFIWAKAMGGTGFEKCNSVALDPTGGDIYTTGIFEGTADFDPGGGTFDLISDGTQDIFISKLDSSGNFIWAKRMGGISIDGGASIAFDPAGNGNIYTTGYFQGSADFDPGAGTFDLISAGGSDIFFSKLDTSGNFVWSKAMGGTTADNGLSIALDALGRTYLAGSFQSSSVIFGSTTLTNAGISGADIFIARLDTVFATGDNEIENFDKSVFLFPNPARDFLTITLPSPDQKVEITITDITGKIIYTTTATQTQKLELNTKDFAEGIYVVQIQAADFMETKKLVVAQ